MGALAADLQDPPELFVEMIRAWEKGFPIVAAIKKTSNENGLMYVVRTYLLSLGRPSHECERSGAFHRVWALRPFGCGEDSHTASRTRILTSAV